MVIWYTLVSESCASQLAKPWIAGSIAGFCSYTFFWFIVGTCKFAFSYFLQVYSSDISYFIYFLGRIFYDYFYWCYFTISLVSWISNKLVSMFLTFVVWRVQIQPMVGPTRTVISIKNFNYRWRDLISQSTILSALYVRLWGVMLFLMKPPSRIWSSNYGDKLRFLCHLSNWKESDFKRYKDR